MLSSVLITLGIIYLVALVYYIRRSQRKLKLSKNKREQVDDEEDGSWDTYDSSDYSSSSCSCSVNTSASESYRVKSIAKCTMSNSSIDHRYTAATFINRTIEVEKKQSICE